MADFTSAAVNRILSWFFTPDDAPRPTQFYLALFSANVEIVYAPGYVRQPVAFHLNPHGPGEIVNSHAVNFVAGMAGFPTVNKIILFETAAGGFPLWEKQIAERNVNSYETLRIQTEAILIKLT